MKKYNAKTNVSVNIVLTSGANRHVTFSPLSGGGSVFYTEDPEVQKALERHYKFGTLFRIDPAFASETAGAMVKKPQVSSKNEVTGDVVEADSNGLNKVEISDPDAAKTYLADHFGVSRTKLKSLKAIKEVAAANGIEFVGI